MIHDDLGVMTEQALADLLGLKMTTMANKRSLGELPPCINVGARRLYLKKTVAQWLERQEERPTPPLRPPAARRNNAATSATRGAR